MSFLEGGTLGGHPSDYGRMAGGGHEEEESSASSMSAQKSSFLDKILGRIERLHTESLQSVVQRLANERNFLEMLFNTIEDGVLVVDKAGAVIYFNQAVTQLIGLPSETPLGQIISRYLPGLDWDQLSTPDASGAKRVVRHEFEIGYPRPRFLRLYAAPLTSETNRKAGVVLILHDATEARQKAFAAIESERVQALALLSASVAHEIGNPLNALYIHVQLMERELKKLKSAASTGVDELLLKSPRKPRAAKPSVDLAQITRKLEDFLGVAKGEITRLDDIITQFLHAIRPTPPKIQITSLNDVVGAALELLRPELENRGLEAQDLRARQMPLAPLDAAQIKQALVNLMKNAMQAMTKGGTLSLETGQGNDEVWVSVADTGGGIPQEIISRIFDPFYTTKKKGTGLGLMIVSRIVREHGGHIEVDSRAGQGTTFRIRLPQHEPLPRLLEARTKEEPASDHQPKVEP